jgi:diguanylate cyclase (GGDEF)-like protein/putative nucleotidyltransferase with HDIG domain
MTEYSVAPLVSVIAYGILSVIVVRDLSTRTRKIFATYIILCLIFAIGTFITFSYPHTGQIHFWSALLPIGSIATLVAYHHFICSFTHTSNRIVVVIGYVFVVFVMVPLAALGYLPESAQLIDSGLEINYGAFQYMLTITGSILVGLSIFLLVRRLRILRDPTERSRTIYLLAGIVLFTLFCIREAIPPIPRFPISQIGHLLNAIVITYAIIRYNLADVKLVIRKGLVYSGVTAFVTLVFLATLFSLNDLLEVTWSSPAGLSITTGIVILMAIIFNPLKSVLEKLVDRIIYGSRYDYRKTVLDVASKLSNVIELEELADALLRPIVKAVNASQVSLLFLENEHYNSHFAQRLREGDPVIPVSLRQNSAISTWFDNEDKPLHRDIIESEPIFKGLWQKDRDSLDAAQVDVLCPVKSKQKLIAILALSKKHPGGYYGSDDLDLLMTLSHEAAIAIENAQMYERAKERANTDALTGLYNHRHCHERIDEEIARSSRFGEVFSLLLIDMDHFKNYNDVYGHIAGDDVLKQLGEIINKAIRVVDIGFRYGGDEFAVLMPGTSLEAAKKVAERLRKSIEAQTDMKGIPQTCSVGVSSWPTDGMLREEIIQSADAALYHAKRTGGNRISIACEVVLSGALRADTLKEQQNNNNMVISTIYALAATVDAKDHYTYGHSKKVSQYAIEIAEELGYSREGIERIRASALLHDIGKIGLSDNLLSKVDPLCDDDWTGIQAHPSLGVSILKHVNDLTECLAGVQYHHERFDGTGYPSGLQGENIPLDARILAVADSFDAMTSNRPYRSWKFSAEEALEELKRCAGKQFDPVIVDAFVKIRTQKDKLAVEGR